MTCGFVLELAMPGYYEQKPSQTVLIVYIHTWVPLDCIRMLTMGYNDLDCEYQYRMVMPEA